MNRLGSPKSPWPFFSQLLTRSSTGSFKMVIQDVYLYIDMCLCIYDTNTQYNYTVMLLALKFQVVRGLDSRPGRCDTDYAIRFVNTRTSASVILTTRAQVGVTRGAFMLGVIKLNVIPAGLKVAASGFTVEH